MLFKQDRARALSCGELARNREADDSAANYLFDFSHVNNRVDVGRSLGRQTA
jgi:hypothetical protein